MIGLKTKGPDNSRTGILPTLRSRTCPFQRFMQEPDLTTAIGADWGNNVGRRITVLLGGIGGKLTKQEGSSGIQMINLKVQTRSLNQLNINLLNRGSGRAGVMTMNTRNLLLNIGNQTSLE